MSILCSTNVWNLNSMYLILGVAQKWQNLKILHSSLLEMSDFVFLHSFEYVVFQIENFQVGRHNIFYLQI
jgi:hypothetical protein